MERDATAWLEPMADWLNVASSLAEAAQSNDLPSKKFSLQKIFGSIPTLHDRRIQEIPLQPYAALRAAREKFSENDVGCIGVRALGVEPRTFRVSVECSTN